MLKSRVVRIGLLAALAALVVGGDLVFRAIDTGSSASAAPGAPAPDPEQQQAQEQQAGPGPPPPGDRPGGQDAGRDGPPGGASRSPAAGHPPAAGAGGHPGGRAL